eukprot:CAMPEP_0176466220 /NCGR_PEP_ID=MMETSP0127-20121128/37768_1 /TAXON_ID=938130 /ORGANISM="Platyophrya macrostoma, Strain WH" /LENGTH=452 /DNA_ID=CAMNT_0017859357 /DNA_START=338 /DNA_END=1696 /DNA_ORIENTATION=-
MSHFFRSEISSEIMQEMNEAFIKPYLRSLPLRREQQFLETFSLFQYHLNDVAFNLNSEAQTFGNNSEKEYFDFTDAEKNQFQSIQEEEKDLMLSVRWHLKPEQSKKKMSPILEIYSGLYEYFSDYCKLVANYLSSLDNPFYFTAEYTTKWKNYTMSMQIIGSILKEFSSAVNEGYNLRFKEHSGLPDFSIWRMMTKIWHEEVFSVLEKKMLASFELSFESYLSQFSTKIQGHIDEEIIPKELIQASDFEITTSISEFWQSVVDMGFNERTITSLTFTDMSEIKPISSFWFAAKELVERCCKSVTEAPQIRPSLKFEQIVEYTDLIESIIPFKTFPELQEVLLEAQFNIIANFIAEKKNESIESISKLITGEDVKSMLEFVHSEEIECKYPALLQHIKHFQSNAENFEEVKLHRETQKSKYLLQSTVKNCRVQMLLVNYNNQMDLSSLEESKI